MALMDESNLATEDKQIQAKFVTKLPRNFKVPTTVFSIPAHLNRYGLSEVINTLLGLEEIQPFDFLIEGELLRTSIEKFLLSKNISAETVINIEYIKAVPPPKLKTKINHDDWICAVDASFNDLILSGSYDTLGRLYDKNGLCNKVLVGHGGPVKDICVLKPQNDMLIVVTASDDNTLRLWNVNSFNDNDTDAAEQSKNKLNSSDKREIEEINDSVIFKGHESSVQCVDSSFSGLYICSGGWDKCVRVWKTTEFENSEDEEDAENSSSKRKKGQKNAKTHSSKIVKSNVCLKGHSQCVSSVCYDDDAQLFSASHDYSIRCWDAETSINTLTLTGTKAIYTLGVQDINKSIMCTGGADSVVRIWDTRSNNLSPILQLFSHQGWISKVSWSHKDEYHLLSGAYDGKIKLWDMRTKVPLSTLDAHDDKVLCVDWFTSNNSVVSGGNDNQLKIFSNIQI